MTSDSDDLATVTATAVFYEQGTVVVFKGESPGGPVEFVAADRTAAAIVEALQAGETPTVDVP